LTKHILALGPEHLPGPPAHKPLHPALIRLLPRRCPASPAAPVSLAHSLMDRRHIQQVGGVPTILTVGPCRFFFYSADGGEPPHVHVERGRSSAKFWIEPVVLVRSHGFARAELLDIHRIIAENEQRFRKAWDDYFGDR
jgi:hypothetical protein